MTCEICDGAMGGVEGNDNLIDGVKVCDYCHCSGEYAITEDDFQKAAVARAKEIYPNKPICLDGVLDFFKPVMVKGGKETLTAIEEAGQCVALNSAWWNGDFP